jgi:hypothetical protein
MQRLYATFAIGLFGISASGCFTVTPAPGADKVKVTDSPTDVAACTAVGNINVPAPEISFDGSAQMTALRNQAVALGGNAALVTVNWPNGRVDGIAYRCP